jgi:hypothetical protein
MRLGRLVNQSEQIGPSLGRRKYVHSNLSLTYGLWYTILVHLSVPTQCHKNNRANPSLRCIGEQIALASEAFAKAANGAAAKKVIVVPGRLVNVVA